MKKIAALLLLSIGAPAAAANLFQPWCNTFTAEGLVSLAANRIYGHISELDDDAYAERKAWVQNASQQAEKRFSQMTGKDFEAVDWHRPADWAGRCQLKNQIH